MPYIGLVGLMFVAAKLTHYIDWSWVWVLAPFWIGLAILLCILVIGVVFGGAAFGIFGLITARNSRRMMKARQSRFGR